MKKKVLAYIYRDQTKKEILVFNHCAYPEVSPQVIGGTVENDEDLSLAIIREVFEEPGVALNNPVFIDNYIYLRKDINEKQERNIFEFISESLPSHWKHTVSSGEEDKGLEFEFYWLPIKKAKELLVADMGLYL